MERIMHGDSVAHLGERQTVMLFGREMDAHLEVIQAVHKHYDGLRATFGLAIVSEDSPAPDAEYRSRAADAYKDMLGVMRAFAIVIEGNDINATTKRTMARVVVGLSGHRVAFRVFREAGAAGRWLREQGEAYGVDVFAEASLEQLQRSA